MMTSSNFHEVRFPVDLALGAAGGPVRRTEIITLGSGIEKRNTRWANSRRKYNAGYGIKTIEDLYDVIDFFEQRRGRLFGFRFRDPIDFKSSRPRHTPSVSDQQIGTGDGSQSKFQLTKKYGSGEAAYERKVAKPVDGTVIVAIDGNVASASDYSVDHTTGQIEFSANKIPSAGQMISAGFEFDIPVRFDADEITVNLKNFQAGDIPSIPLLELLT